MALLTRFPQMTSNMTASGKSERKLTVFMQRLSPRGGQERSTLEILKRLSARGWDVIVYGFELEGWPSELAIGWHRLRGRRIPLQLIKHIWFLTITFFKSWRESKRGLTLATGVDCLVARVRVVQFVHETFVALAEKGKLPYPNPRTRFHVLYQSVIARWYRWIERRFLARSELHIAISQSVRADLHRYHGALNVKVIPHAVDRRPTHLPTSAQERGCHLLFVGALERKGIETALRSLAQIRDLPWKFTAVGGGNLAHWKILASQLGMASRVEFLGERPASPYFGKATILVLPTILEPFGLVVTEAISEACLPLASQECGAMELWPGRDPALKLSCCDSPERWGQALRRLLTEPAFYEAELSSAATAFGKWSWERVADAYEEELGRLLTQGSDPTTARRVG